MIKTFVASTAEVDDVATAVEEIVSQLDLAGGLLKNSIAIMSCHYEFVDSGVVKAVCDALPFDVAGTISSPLSGAGEMDSFLMTVMVITADDVEFVNVLTSSLNEAPGQVIAKSYEEAAAARTDKPELILAFAPFMMQNSGDEYVETISKASGGVPCFGTLAVDDTLDFSSCYLLHNGQDYPDRMSMILCYGNISPKFYLVSMSHDKVLDKSAVITKSEGHVIMELNGRPVDAFLGDLGLIQVTEGRYAMSSLPFFLDYNDGTPKVSKNIITLTPERHVLCASAMPEGCTVQIAQTDKNDIMLTTKQATQQILEDVKNASALLIYSCVGRCMVLGGDQFDEMRLVEDALAGSVPYMMMYSGGEICPTLVEDGKATNRFHNNAFIACMF